MTHQQLGGRATRWFGALLLGAWVSSAHSFDLKIEAARCAGCHGADGRAAMMHSSGRIAGQSKAYLIYILKQYRAGRLSGIDSAIMIYAVKQLSDEHIEALARYYAELP